MSSSEGMNEASKLIAQAMRIIHNVIDQVDAISSAELNNSYKLLNTALDKLIT